MLGQSPKKVKVEHYIDKESQQVVSKMVGLSERIIVTLENYYQAMQDALKERKKHASQFADHELRKRSHMIV